MNGVKEPIIFGKRISIKLAIERNKMLFQFIVMFFSSLLLGIISTKLLSEGFLRNSNVIISLHFELPFSNCDGFASVVREIFYYSAFDLVSALAIFLASFSVLNYFISDLMIILGGFKTGFSIALLAGFIDNSDAAYSVGVSRFLLFCLFRIALVAYMVFYAWRSALYSFDLRRSDELGRAVMNPKTLLNYFLFSLTFTGTLLIINAAYCGIIYIL